MNKIKRIIVAIGCGAIFAVNIPFAIPRFYKGNQQEVGPEIVAVYTPGFDSRSITVPVVNPNASFAETGQRVEVYLRNNYKDAEIQFTPRATLFLMLGFGFLYAIVSCISQRKRQAV